jgi:hypothetical protein
MILNRECPSLGSFLEKISLSATAAGGHHAKRKHHKEESQDALGHLAIPMVEEDIGWEKDL